MENVKITWSGATDIGAQYMVGGYEGNVLFNDVIIDYPTPVVNEEVIADGFGNEEIVFARVGNRVAFVIDSLHEAQVFGLAMIRYYDLITLIDRDTSESWELKNFTFEALEQDECFMRGKFSFEIGNQITRRSSDDNFNLI